MSLSENNDALRSMSASGKWSTFFLAKEMFALRVEDVQEVLMYQPLTPVPLAPEHIVGLLNLRGQVMTAIDLRRRLQFAPRTGDRPGTFIVMKIHERLTCLVVDEIGDVLDLPSADWRPTPETLTQANRDFVFGICPIAEQMVLGLRADALGGDDERSARGDLAGRS